ncbi:MAG: Gfo/Idh/MocA family oxidoreductase, partial [Patescibacteria group bacterium]
MHVHATMPPRKQLPIFRIGILGCGNIVQTLHLPALQSLPEVSVPWLVDHDKQALALMGKHFPHARQSNAMEAMQALDGVLIATPPGMHAQHIRFALERGWHVLVEKPLTTNTKDAEELIRLAEEKKLTLCVNTNRRFFPAATALTHYIQSGRLGTITRIEIVDGQHATGGATSMQSFHATSAAAGGGVLIDTGSHMIDYALSLLQEPKHTRIDYADDGETGIEAECRFDIDCSTTQGAVRLHGFLSRIAAAPQTVTVQGTRGTVQATFPDNDLKIWNAGEAHLPPLTYKTPLCVGSPFISSFRTSIQTFIHDATVAPHTAPHAARHVLKSLSLMTACYATRTPLTNPWGTHVTIPKNNNTGGKKIVAIIGAGGFLGSRLFERLHQSHDYIPRAITHSSIGSFGILRYTNDVLVGDAADPAFLHRALDGVDAVVNCAINMRGTRHFAIRQTRAIAAATAQVAAHKQIRRYVHISTIAVHGMFLGRTEDVLRLDPQRTTYAIAKHTSEQDVLRVARAKKLSVIILRMGHIYGPYSTGWSLGQQALVRTDELTRVEEWRNPSNTVFVDNAIDAIESALVAPTSPDEPLYVTDVPNQNWQTFYAPLFALEGKKITDVPNVSFETF